MSFRDYIPRHLWPFRVYVPSVRMSISLCEYILPCGCPIRVYIPPPHVCTSPPFAFPIFFRLRWNECFCSSICQELTPIFRFTSKCQVSSRMDWVKRKDIGKGSSTVFLNENILIRAYCRELLNENGKCDLSPSRGLRGNTNKYCATYCADEIVKQKIWIERHPCRIYGH